MLRPTSDHCQVHSWSIKHIEEEIHFLCFKDQLWSWQWPEIGQSILFCIIITIWLCMDRYWFNIWTAWPWKVKVAHCFEMLRSDGQCNITVQRARVTGSTAVRSWKVLCCNLFCGGCFVCIKLLTCQKHFMRLLVAQSIVYWWRR